MSRRRHQHQGSATRSAATRSPARPATQRGSDRQWPAVTGDAPCPCGLAQPYGQCCARYHGGSESAATAESLMRSRYAAFAVGDADYLVRTWHPSTRPSGLRLTPDQRWTNLEIVAVSGGGLFDDAGTVEFRAYYTEAGQADVMAERSRFSRVEGQWYYLDGVVRDSALDRGLPLSRL